MNKFILISCFLGFFFNSFGQEINTSNTNEQSKLPETATSLEELKSPSEFLGYPLGSQFTRSWEVNRYYKHVASVLSKQVTLENYGTTYERRPLYIAIISSPENMANLNAIRKQHLNSTKEENNGNKAIVWLSYNVHGNESVSTETSMLTIYTLLTKKKDYLKNTIVIIDPCLNPDGRDRYVNWYYQNKNTPHNIDLNSKEHHEPWLSGRPNHYMFDLNRDWAWLTQLESEQRIKVYNKWLPHIHVDFHEQGINNPYYFAPAAEPFHEVITDFQKDFQTAIGKNHARYFDANGWFYFTRERFDLFYPSYGDTYPTYNGSIGMTYEQGGSGSAGLGVVTAIKDTLTLNHRIQHHHTTGLSTVEMASKNVEKLHQEFTKFFSRPKNFKYKSYILEGNPDRLNALKSLLNKHQIKYYKTASEGTFKGYNYLKGANGSAHFSENALIVPSQQTKGTLVKVLFEPKAKLTDSLTYDITAWSLPYAYGLKTIASENELPIEILEETNHEKTVLDNKAYAFISDWSSLKDAQFLASLLKNNIKVRFSSTGFSLAEKTFKRGSLIITKADNKKNADFLSTLAKLANDHKKKLFTSPTGFVDNGKDFGSSTVSMVSDLKIAVLSGAPTSSLQFGEIWHFFEQQLNYPITVINSHYFKATNLSSFNTLILPSGNYKNYLKEADLNKLHSWVKKGGKLIVMGKALKPFAKASNFSLSKQKKSKQKDSVNLVAHEIGERNYIKNLITGAIFKTKVDNTHPLAYGYSDTYFTLKLGADAYNYLNSGNVAYLEDNAVAISGFTGSEAEKKIGKTLVFGTENIGKGNVVYLVDNPLFRGFWENGKLFFANALFMVN